MSSDPFSAAAVNRQDVRQYPCKQCGAQLTYNATSHQMVCGYCGYSEIIPVSRDAIREYAYNDALVQPQATGWGTETRTIQCDNCGAKTTFQAGQIAAACAFCGSSKVVEAQSSTNLIRPESLVPFQVDKNLAVQKFRQWISALWFRPNDLKKLAELAKISGIYLPFWTYDANTQSWWEAEAGYYYYTTETYTEQDSDGNTVVKTREVQHIRWEPASGHYQAFFDDELIFASIGLDLKMVEGLYPYDGQGLVAYESAFLAGWLAEEYKIDVKEGWQRAKKIITNKIYSACESQIPGDTHRNLSVQSAFSNIAYKHILLPLWIAAYMYGNKSYKFLVNGQSGKVSGEAPYSWIKIASLIFVLVAIITIIIIIAGHKK
jgi:hypothetical protein